MKQRISNLIHLPGILLLCFVGCVAGMFGFRRLDNWCTSRLLNRPVNSTPVFRQPIGTIRDLGTAREWEADILATLLWIVLVAIFVLLLA